MKQVWKCEYCSQVDVNPDVIMKHEDVCSFNKKNKKCYTCEYHYEEGYNGEHIPGCEIRLNASKYEEEGNCPGWVYQGLSKEREERLKELGL